jgi:hypothetical protein
MATKASDLTESPWTQGTQRSCSHVRTCRMFWIAQSWMKCLQFDVFFWLELSCAIELYSCRLPEVFVMRVKSATSITNFLELLGWSWVHSQTVVIFCDFGNNPLSEVHQFPGLYFRTPNSEEPLVVTEYILSPHCYMYHMEFFVCFIDHMMISWESHACYT